jgi:hypothetical protein
VTASSRLCRCVGDPVRATSIAGNTSSFCKCPAASVVSRRPSTTKACQAGFGSSSAHRPNKVPVHWGIKNDGDIALTSGSKTAHFPSYLDRKCSAEVQKSGKEPASWTAARGDISTTGRWIPKQELFTSTSFGAMAKVTPRSCRKPLGANARPRSNLRDVAVELMCLPGLDHRWGSVGAVGSVGESGSGFAGKGAGTMGCGWVGWCSFISDASRWRLMFGARCGWAWALCKMS